MTEAERIWREKSDQELLDAATELEEFTEEGQRVILAEIDRRGLELPDDVREPGIAPYSDEEADTGEPLECLRCDVELRYLGTVQLERGGAGLAALGGLIQEEHIEVFMCPRCGKIELFAGSATEEDEKEEEEEEGLRNED